MSGSEISAEFFEDLFSDGIEQLIVHRLRENVSPLDIIQEVLMSDGGVELE